MLNFFKKLFAGKSADSAESAPYKIETPAADPIEINTAVESEVVDQPEPETWPFPGSAPGVPATPVAEAKPAARKPRAAKAKAPKAAPAETTKTADKKPAQPRKPRKPRATS
jgi:hypothetical protein